MQKRSLVFLFILTLSLLAVNLFFKPQKEAQKKAQTEQVAQTKSLESRVATQAGLPLVDLYKDSDGKTYLTTGLLLNGNLFTFKWDEQLPKTVYFKKSHTSLPLQSASLNDNEASILDPIVYKSKEAENHIQAAQLPSKGSFEVQLVQPKAYNKNPQIYSSFFSNGNFSSIGPINGNAIAMAATQDGYEPIGIYLGSEAKLIPLKDFFSLKQLVSLHQANFQSNSNENFYVLENEYQQLVFSTKGGALAEINLPIKSKENSSSYVYPTSQDQLVAESASKHSVFPAHNFQSANSAKKDQDPQRGGYYPLIRRSLDAPLTDSRYYAFNIVSDYPGISDQEYKVTHIDKQKIVFQANQNYRKITKTFTLNNKVPYGLGVDIQIEGDRNNLWITTGVPEAEFGSNMQPPSIKYRQLKNNKFEIVKQKLPKASTDLIAASPDWVSNSNGFFTILVDPETKGVPGYKVNKVLPETLLSRVDTTPTSKGKKAAGYECLLPLSDSSSHFDVYAGPLDNTLLKLADTKVQGSNYLGAQSYQGFLTFISEPCAKILFSLMSFIHKMVGSWGLSIILLTVVLRIILYPLNTWSIRAMRKTQEIAPEVSAIQKKYKKNPKQAQIEVMSLYKKRKVNPITGCLPMLIQMPFLMGMFNLLKSAFVLRGVPFISGWINNLTAPDVLFTWSHSIPFFGNEFHLLPIISCAMIWLQQKMTNVAPADKALMTDQQKQQKMMGNVMVIFITLLCYNLPSGLNLYFIFSTLLGVVQQVVTNRLLDKKKSKPKILTSKKVDLEEKKA